MLAPYDTRDRAFRILRGRPRVSARTKVQLLVDVEVVCRRFPRHISASSVAELVQFSLVNCRK